MKSLHLVYHCIVCIVGKCFGIWDVRVAYNLWDDDGDDRRLPQYLRYVMWFWEVHSEETEGSR